MNYHTTEFLNFLGIQPDSYHIFVRIQKDNRTKVFGRPDMGESKNEKFVANMDGKSQVYVSVNPCKKIYNKPHISEVLYWNCEYIDIDVERPDHTVPATDQELRGVKPQVGIVKKWLKAQGFLPGYTDFTGNGWRILLPVPTFDLKSLSHDEVLYLNEQKKEWLRGVEKETGVDIDVGINELSRITGIPGTVNFKAKDDRDRRRQPFRGCKRIVDQNLQEYVMSIEVPEDTINREGYVRNADIDDFVELLREIDKSLDTMLERAGSIKKGHRSSFDFAIVRKLGEYDISEPDCEYILRNHGTKRVENDDYVRNTVKKGLK